ncbi:MAG: hypothetical protein RJB01_598 [Actinomycetota bacterium]
MKIRRIAVASAIALAVSAAPAFAEGAFNATVSGIPANAPLANLASTSELTINALNLPAGVGLYALHCQVPSNPRSAPTVCDPSTGALAYIPAGAARDTLQIPIKVNAEFFGTNPNPQGGASAPTLVDCRTPQSNPRATTCGLYVLGAGREAANPTYLRFWPTTFAAVKSDRAAQKASVTVDGTVVGPKKQVALKKDAPVSFAVKLNYDLTADVSADNCRVADGQITALADTGTCTVRITSNGGKNVLPFQRTQVFTLS